MAVQTLRSAEFTSTAEPLQPFTRLMTIDCLEFFLPADHERLQRAPDHRPGRLRRSVRLQEGRHGKDVSALPGGREGHGRAATADE